MVQSCASKTVGSKALTPAVIPLPLLPLLPLPLLPLLQCCTNAQGLYILKWYL